MGDLAARVGTSRSSDSSGTSSDPSPSILDQPAHDAAAVTVNILMTRRTLQGTHQSTPLSTDLGIQPVSGDVQIGSDS